MAAGAVMPHLGLAGYIGALLVRVTLRLAAMIAAAKWLIAALAAAILHELLDAAEASTLVMANLTADVAASEREAARVATVGRLLVAEYLVESLLAATARPRHKLHALRAASQVAGELARVTTGERLLAWSTTSGLYLAAPDWWFNLRDAARAVERLTRVHSAWLAEAQVAELIALVHAALQRLVACVEAEMATLRISNSLLDRTAHFLALVLLADLELMANFFADEVSRRLEVFNRVKHALNYVVGVVYDIARDLPLRLAATACLSYDLLAAHALVGMTCFATLVLPARQEALTLALAERDRVCAGATRSTDQRLDSVVAAWAVAEALRIARARLALTVVAPSLACVAAAVERTTASLLAPALASSARSLPLFLSTEATQSDLMLARLARAFMARIFAFVMQTV